MGAPPAMFVDTPLAKLQAPQFRAHNYSAGAAALDTEVMLEVQAEFVNYQGSGMGIHEMSQRDPGGPVQLVLQGAEDNLRTLLDIPDNYKVLFFQVSPTRGFSKLSQTPPFYLISQEVTLIHLTTLRYSFTLSVCRWRLAAIPNRQFLQCC
jgi:phosphoserine aminotransferase